MDAQKSKGDGDFRGDTSTVMRTMGWARVPFSLGVHCTRAEFGAGGRQACCPSIVKRKHFAASKRREQRSSWMDS